MGIDGLENFTATGVAWVPLKSVVSKEEAEEARAMFRAAVNSADMSWDVLRTIMENDVIRHSAKERERAEAAAEKIEAMADEVETWVEDLKPDMHFKASSRAVERRGDLPWAQYIWQQCKAYREPREGGKGYHGRCELLRNHVDEGMPLNVKDHALERGMDIPRWSTEWTA